MRILTRVITILTGFALFGAVWANANESESARSQEGVNSRHQEKPRIIVTTDGEIDDKTSFVRFLLYTNDFDIEGLIYTNSRWHPRGNGTRWMHDLVDVYEEVWENLKVHHPDFPAPDQLRSLIYVGQNDHVGSAGVGEGMDTPGSDRIVEILLDDDPRPVWLQAWGGLNNICQALYRIQQSHPEKWGKAAAKAQVYAIAEQDDLRGWMEQEAPEVMYILNRLQFWRVIAYAHDRRNPFQDHEIYSSEWVEKHINSQGPLGAQYLSRVQEEGDSPAFFHVMDTGLRSTEDPAWGGWGGRFERVETGNLWLDAEDDGDPTKPLWRFIVPISEDFAARMQWSVKSRFEEANHAPVVALGHKDELRIKPQETVELDASASYDPDGDELSFHWWQYKEAGTYGSEVAIENSTSSRARVTIPADAAGKSIHIICEVQDDAELTMTRYRRVILQVE